MSTPSTSPPPTDLAATGRALTAAREPLKALLAAVEGAIAAADVLAHADMQAAERAQVAEELRGLHARHQEARAEAEAEHQRWITRAQTEVQSHAAAMATYETKVLGDLQHRQATTEAECAATRRATEARVAEAEATLATLRERIRDATAEHGIQMANLDNLRALQVTLRGENATLQQRLNRMPSGEPVTA